MSWDVREQLIGYLSYFNEMGIQGLAIPQNPFAPQRKKANTLARTIPKVEKEVAKPTIVLPGLGQIMENVELSGPQSQAELAKNVSGEHEEGLRNLYKTFSSCMACALGTTRNQFVFGEGNPNAELMFVGEGPGADEDMSGRPFVGRAGELLNKIIGAMGFAREDVFIANVVKCRPPENRNPLPDEMATCSPILKRQVEMVKPQVIVVLGATALKYFHGANASITRMRGDWLSWQGVKVMPTFHPAYVLRNPASKRQVWEDVQKVMAFLKETAGGA